MVKSTPNKRSRRSKGVPKKITPINVIEQKDKIEDRIHERGSNEDSVIENRR